MQFAGGVKMKIAIPGYELQRVIKTCKPCVSTDESRPGLTHIELECADNGIGYATALDGFKMIQTSFSFAGDSGVILLPVLKDIDKHSDYEIELADGMLSVSDGKTKVIRKACDSPFINWRKVAEKTAEPTFKIGVNPQCLKKVLDVSGSCVVLEFYDELGGFFVQGDGVTGMVLPVRISTGYDHFRRFPLEDRGVQAKEEA